MLKEISFIELSNEWLNLKKYSIKHSTFIKYKNVIELYLIDYFKDKDIETCDENDLCHLFDYLSKEKLLSTSILKSSYSILKTILRYGEKKYNFKNFNFSYIRIPTYKHDVVVLLTDEERLLAKYCLSHVNNTTLAIYISLYTGLRLGEICGLKWEDIDLTRGYINISRTVQRIQNIDELSKTKKMVLDPKTQLSKRTVVMSDALIKYLEDYKENIGVDMCHPFFLLSNSLIIPEPRSIQRNFKKICSQLSIDSNFHILRHTFATNCIKHGIDVKTLCELLGHSNISTTLNLYVHPTLEYKREQINKIFNLQIT